MARETKSKTSDEVARGADVPLALAQTGARDALLDPREGDILPDLATKGMHVGEIAQPAEPVLHRGGDVTFESLPEAPESRFVAGTYAEQVARNDAEQRDDERFAGVEHRAILTDPDAVAKAKAALDKAPRPVAADTASNDGEPTKADLRAEIDSLGGEQPGSRATVADLTEARDAARSGGSGSAASDLASDADAVADAQAAEDQQ